MATQACVFNICFSVPAGLGGLIPGATTSSSPTAAVTTSAAASPTTTAAAGTTVVPATTIVSAGQTITAAASTITGAAATVTQTLVRTVTAAAGGAGASAGASGAGAGGLGGQSVAPNGLPAIPSGIVLPDNFKLPPGFKLPPKPKYQFDLDDRLSEAVIYAILLFPTLYLLWKHGRRGWLIWPLMASFCIVEIVKDALFMWPGGDLLKIGAGWITTAAMTLLLLVSFPLGLNFEAASYIPSTGRASRFLIFVITSLFFVLGLILGTIGSVPLSLVAQIRNKPYNLKMARAGYILMLLFLFFTWLHSFALLRKTSARRYAETGHANSQRKRIRALLWGSILATPFIAVRLGRNIDYSFNYDKPTRNPLNGSFVTIFVFVWLMQLLAYLVILIAGFVALRIKFAHRAAAHGHGVDGTHHHRRSDVYGDESDVDIKAEEQALGAGAGAGAVGATAGGGIPRASAAPKRHRFRRRRHADDVVAGGPVARGEEDGYYVPEKQHAVREV